MSSIVMFCVAGFLPEIFYSTISESGKFDAEFFVLFYSVVSKIFNFKQVSFLITTFSLNQNQDFESLAVSIYI